MIVSFCSVVLAGVISLGQSAAAEPADGGASPPMESWTQRFDRRWSQRDEHNVLEELYNLAKEAQKKNANDFDANLRLAQVLDWQADGLADGTNAKAQSGKQGWNLAEKALAVNSQDVRAHYYAATGIGLYSEGVGILTALGEGLEGKFRSRAEAALKLDKNFLDGAPQVLWGRYFFKLPWPKRDVSESIKVLRVCTQEHPRNLRGKLYLAESLLDDGKKQEAKQLIEQIDAAPIGVDGPEDRRIKARAQQWAKQHQGDLG
jgi:hypothetical protein